MKRRSFAMAILATLLAWQLPVSAATPVYRLCPDDTLNVTVVGHPDLSVTDEAVRPDGRISLPLVSQLVVGGKTVGQVTTDLQRAYRPFLTSPLIVVNVEHFHSLRISVLGQVEKPGVYEFTTEPSLTEALAAAGGPTPRAARDDIDVKSTTGSSERFDLDRLIADPDHIPLIQEGSAIDVHEVWYPDLHQDIPIAATVVLAVAEAFLYFKQ